MTKKEVIWREILYQTLEKGQRKFTQKELAKKFAFSTSTVFNALKVPRQIEAARVTGRNFILLNPEKLLYLWGTFRNLKKDIVYQTATPSPIQEIEALLPPGIILGTYSAFRQKFNETPADYDKTYVYAPSSLVDEIKKRFPPKKGYLNLIILKADQFMADYGLIATLAQTFVDLWNLPEWYASDFQKALKEKIGRVLA